MKKLKEMFFSERGMGIVNMLFCLSLLIRVGWLTVLTYLVWADVSRLSAGNTPSQRRAGVINTVFLVIAAVLACVNLYFMF